MNLQGSYKSKGQRVLFEQGLWIGKGGQDSVSLFFLLSRCKEMHLMLVCKIMNTLICMLLMQVSSLFHYNNAYYHILNWSWKLTRRIKN
jgi:hypothetical protein